VRQVGSCKDPEFEGVKVAGDPDSRDDLASEQTRDEPSPGASPSDAAALPEDRTPLEDTVVIEEEAAAEAAASVTPAEKTGPVPTADMTAEGQTVEPAAAQEEVAQEEVAQEEAEQEEAENVKQWYILKVQVNREESIRRALERRVKVAGLERFFGEIVVPTEDVAEYNKSGKRRIVKKKLYPGYLMINLALNDDTWFLVRETPGIGDFTGSAGKPTPMEPHEVQRIVVASKGVEAGESPVKTAIPFKPGDRVRVKEGYFENFEGDVESIDEANGRITVMINIFGRSTPVELEHWQVESV
jgi:transcription termination/antitermination protein NusG